MSKKRINNFISDEKPFAVIVYKQYLRSNNEVGCYTYEVLYEENRKLKSFVLKDDVVTYFNSIISKFVLKIQNAHGKVYEFLNFKESENITKEMAKTFEQN